MYQEGLYAPAPNDLVLMRFYIWVDGHHFCFPRDALLYHRHPCEWRLQLVFYPIGAILLLGSIVCLARFGLQEQRRKHLKTNVISVVGKIQSVRHLVWINWNTKTFVNWPGQCSPWVVQCSYCYGGRTYTVKSLLSWIKPATDFQQPVIYLDPRNPVHAYVDMDTIKWELSSF